MIMTELKPDTYYYYQYGHEKHGLSHVKRFKSRPRRDSKYAKFIAYADMGAYAAPGSASTASRVYEDVVGRGYDSFLLHFGDIRYEPGIATRDVVSDAHSRVAFFQLRPIGWLHLGPLLSHD